ncbi:uncharacterized protein LOC122283443 isoform X1 [Carya illinoinensis]|uniref:uncharacterized protein LOC122283443 isoform X1 n=1 Tax=Carya illinoinensis TaxID=32201 RepID=UPI001C71F1E9|nr:uncharacterized protein LOC122283443 isoform X1 [Carya illinoinensis]
MKEFHGAYRLYIEPLPFLSFRLRESRSPTLSKLLLNSISLPCLPLLLFRFRGGKTRLFGYGIGIHLLQTEDPDHNMPKKTEINPKDNHISFQCESMSTVEKKLKEMGITHVRAMVEEGGIHVDQIFFHDPDGFMIEICNCDNLPVVPLVGEMARSCSRVNLRMIQQQQQQIRVVHQ